MLHPSAPTVSAEATPLGHRLNVCADMKIVVYHRGKIDPVTQKPNLTIHDIELALSQPDAIPHVRRLTGDTDDTIVATQKNNAAIDALCK